jgi:hypothetical protein
MISMLAPTEAEAAHGTGTTYDVGGLEVTTYYTPVESYYVRDCVQTIQVWPDFSTSGSKVTAGPYPCSFVSHTKGEGSGKLTSGVYAGSYLNWSYEGLGPNGDRQGFWIDTCPRDSYGGCLQAKVSAAVSENLAQNFGLRRGETFHLENCGTEAANTTACDYFRSGNWIVNDQFTTGIASEKQIDLYYGEQGSAGFRNSAYWLSMYDATIRVNPPPDYELPDTVAPKGTVVISGGATSTANPTNANSVSWNVTFSESVTGVNAADFNLANTGLTGPSITGVTGSGANYTVTADTGSGDGTLGLNLVDDDSIVDGASNKLGGTGAGNGSFTGEIYTIDKTKPVISASATTQPGGANYTAGDWTNKDVQVSFSCADSGSGLNTNTVAGATLTASGADQSVTNTGACTDKAGNTANPATFSNIDIDKVAPTISQDAVKSGTLGLNGWYTSNVGYGFTASDALSGLADADKAFTKDITTEGSAQKVSSGTVTDLAGNEAVAIDSPYFKIDKTAPINVSGSPDRTADSNGWYNRAVGFTFSGNDATSGIASCSTPTYNGPDGTGLTVNGSCTDVAGNQSASVASSAIDYDATAPTNVSGTLARAADHNGWYNASVNYSFSGNDATSGIAANGCSGGTYSGPDGTGLTVGGSCTDRAGNSASATFAFKYNATAPNVSSTSPATIAPSANVSATFSEAMDARTTDGDPSTINATTFKLLRLNADGTTTKVTAAVSYAAATKMAILKPASDLSLGRTYKATVTSGAQDLAGNALDQNPSIADNQSKSWKFTVR